MNMREIMEAAGHSVEYDIGQKVIHQGKEDEIEAYCPLWMNEYRSKTWIQKYVGMGYNLKLCRKTVMSDEIQIYPQSLL